MPDAGIFHGRRIQDASIANDKLDAELKARLLHGGSDALVLGNNDWSGLVYNGTAPVYDVTDRGMSFTVISQSVKLRVRMPVDPNSLYYCRARIKKVTGNGSVYVGAISLDNAFAEINTDLANSWNYFAASNVTITAGNTQTVEGVIGGYNLVSENNPNRFDPEAKYFDLVLILNYNGTGLQESVVESLELFRVPNEWIVNGTLDMTRGQVQLATTTTGQVPTSFVGPSTTNNIQFDSSNGPIISSSANIINNIDSDASGTTATWKLRKDTNTASGGSDLVTMNEDGDVIAVGVFKAGSSAIALTDSVGKILNSALNTLSTAGLVADAALSSNVVFKNAGNVITGHLSFSPAPGTLPAAGGTNVILAGGDGSPNLGRLIIGDGSGWNFTMVTRTGGIDTVRHTWSNGSYTATGTVTANQFTGSGAGLTNIPNSATTATDAATPNTIIARDANGRAKVADPSAATDIATKGFVEAYVAGVRDAKDSCRLATTAALPANTRSGNVLTASANAALSVDGVAVVVGDRILVKNEATGANNGIYTVTATGSGVAPFVLTRATDADSDAEVTGGLFTWITEGSTNADSGWLLSTNDPVVVNTTALSFIQVSGLGQITAGAGLAQTGNTLSVGVDNSSIEITGDTLNVKALGITAAMLAGSIPDSKLSTISSAGKVADSALSANVALENAANVFTNATNQFVGIKLREPSSPTYGAQISMNTAGAWARGFRFSHDSNPNGADTSIAEFGMLGTGAGGLSYAVLGFGLSGVNPLAYNGTHWLTMFPSGNVHVGGNTTDQGFKLFVNGTSKFSGDAMVTGNLRVEGALDRQDVSGYLWRLTSAPTWGEYWDTTTNQIQYHAAGVTKLSFDLDTGDVAAAGNLDVEGVIFAGSSNIQVTDSLGKVQDSALSTNVALKGADNTFTGHVVVDAAAADKRLRAKASSGVAGQGGLQLDQGSTYGFHAYPTGTGGTGGVLNFRYKNIGTDANQDGTANYDFNGTVTADAFSGPGTGLTSIPNSATTATDTATASTIIARDAAGRAKIADPSAATDIANKQYVDAAVAGVRDAKDSCRLATTADHALSGLTAIDGVTPVAGDRILVKNQTAAAQNGIYVAAAGAWSRASDADTNAEVTAGMFTWVTEGTANAESGWLLTTNDPITLGTTALSFVQVSGLGQVTAGAGLAQSGNTLSVNVDNSSIEITGDSLNVKALGITAAMLAGSIPDSKLNTISSAGKVADTALSANVALKNANPAFSAGVSVTGSLGAWTSAGWAQAIKLGTVGSVFRFPIASSTAWGMGVTTDGQLRVIRSSADDNSAAANYDLMFATNGNATFANQVSASQFNGSGAGLTAGTVPDSALSGNVALENVANTFTQPQTFGPSTQTGRSANARATTGANSYFFGHSNTEYLNTIGAFSSSGLPFMAFFAYHGPTANTLRRASGTNVPAMFYIDTAGVLRYQTGSVGAVDTDVADFATRFSVTAAGELTATQFTGSGAGLTSIPNAATTATASATANTIMARDANGRSKAADPAAADDVATKGWVEALTAGVRDAKDSCRLATAAALPTNTRSGNVLTASANAALSVDSVAVVVGDRILVKNEATGANNGIYTVTATGSGVAPFVLTRATDADTSAEVTGGLFAWVLEGSTNADSGWLLTTNDPITLNTTALTFVQVSGLGQVTAGAGLAQSGNTLSVNVDGSSLEITGDTLNVKALGITAAMLAGSIPDSKLSTISTAGKVANTATTAASAKTASAIVARNANGDASLGLLFDDTRAVSTIPNDYASALELNFKQNSAIGTPDASTYSHVAGLRGWSDSSGGQSHELAFTGNGDLYRRAGATTTWGAWKKVLDTGNVVRNEVPGGTKNGSNTAFTLAAAPAAGTLELYMGGLLLTPTTHYSVSGVNITMVAAFAPMANEPLYAHYRT